MTRLLVSVRNAKEAETARGRSRLDRHQGARARLAVAADYATIRDVIEQVADQIALERRASENC